ncbi:hypothetical protein [Ancylobacter polymorphus]|uniref:Uncharacterized protein n=1 Tax=Ancylobacter polymorphus TaxID=223390 RepID=A0ABU0B5I3_9HYPH|nr:hypothetical protein [Ancylobacter polymorphus]MDQ0301078.1 hypothetical protein [Ancylobacter polymorphus]
MKPAVLLRLLGALVLTASLAGAARAQAPETPSPAKICADRWNALKEAGQTGAQSFRDFSAQCLKDAAGPAPAAPEVKPAGEPSPAPAPRRNTTPTGASAAAAQPSIKQCADLWNEMKAKNQTGKQTYRDFAQECLAGTGVLDGKPAEPPPAPKEAAPGAPPAPQTAPPKTSVPSVPRPAATPAPDPAPALTRPPQESDREAVNRCNGEWQAYKARHNLTGAKAWHVFMARCLP